MSPELQASGLLEVVDCNRATLTQVLNAATCAMVNTKAATR
jgi:hypothetical protein